MERSRVHFGNTVISCAIERGRRLKTIAIGVDPVDGVRMRAPGDTPIARLDAIVHRKARWIVERQRRFEDLPPPPSPREFVSGETFRYLGRQYRLKLERTSDADATVRIIGGRLIVPLTTKGTIRRARVNDWSPGIASALPCARPSGSPRGRTGSVCTRRRS